MPPAGVVGNMKGVVSLNLLLQVFLLSHFLANGGFQKAVGRDGAIPEQTTEAGIYRKEHWLQKKKKIQHRKLAKSHLLISMKTFSLFVCALQGHVPGLYYAYC